MTEHDKKVAAAIERLIRHKMRGRVGTDRRDIALLAYFQEYTGHPDAAKTARKRDKLAKKDAAFHAVYPMAGANG